jgi:hypothetical protein
VDKPIKKTNYTRFDNLNEANDYARANEKDLVNLFQYTSNCPQVSRGVTIPAQKPKAVGDIYINTALGKVYIATGVSSTSDFKILN